VFYSSKFKLTQRNMIASRIVLYYFHYYSWQSRTHRCYTNPKIRLNRRIKRLLIFCFQR